MRVADDGVGFVLSERTRSGLGLRSIDERVRLANGHVTVESLPGQGTTLTVRIPRAAVQPSRPDAVPERLINACWLPYPTPFHSRGGSKASPTGPTPITILRMLPVNLLSYAL